MFWRAYVRGRTGIERQEAPEAQDLPACRTRAEARGRAAPRSCALFSDQRLDGSERAAYATQIKPRSSWLWSGSVSFVASVLGAMARFRVKTFAALVNKQAAISTDRAMLRRDYAFLFERFFYYLEDFSPQEIGLIVFDESEKAQCRILLHQLERYFLETAKGYQPQR